MNSFTTMLWLLAIMATVCFGQEVRSTTRSTTLRTRSTTRSTPSTTTEGPESNPAFDKIISSLTRQNCGEFNCKGKGCAVVPGRNKNCPICACPLGSKSRGCDKMPQALNDYLFNSGCPIPQPDGSVATEPAKITQRYYRFIDRKHGIDRCTPYMFPKCKRSVDFNLWRSPESLEECQTICYPENGDRAPTTSEPETEIQQPTTNPAAIDVPTNKTEDATANLINIPDVANATAIEAAEIPKIDKPKDDNLLSAKQRSTETERVIAA